MLRTTLARGLGFFAPTSALLFFLTKWYGVKTKNRWDTFDCVPDPATTYFSFCKEKTKVSKSVLPNRL